MKRIKNKNGLKVGVLLFVIFALLVGASAIHAKTEISMSVWGMPWEDYLYTEVLIPKFEAENPDISVQFYRYEDYWSRIVLLAATGDAPDVMRYLYNRLPYEMTEHLMRLDEFIDGPSGVDMDDFITVPFDIVGWLDGIYFLPTDINIGTVLAYNKDLFDETGLPYPDYSWTLEDMENAAKALTEPGRYGLFWEGPHWTFMSMVHQMGGEVWDQSDTLKEICTLDSEAAIKAAETMQRWKFDEGIVPPVGYREASQAAIQMFSAGRLAMYICGSWMIPAIKRDAPDLNFGVTLFPRGNQDRAPGGETQGCAYTMYKHTEHPEEAWKLLKFLTSHEGIFDYWSSTWVTTPARYSVLEHPEFKRPAGIEGRVPGIDSEEEFTEKLQWHVDALENEWFSMSNISPWYMHMQDLLHGPALEQLLGTVRGDASEVLSKLVEEVHESIQRAK